MQESLKLFGLAFLLPILLSLILSRRWREARTYGFVALACLTLLLNSVALEFGVMFPALEALRWNWLGKTAAILCSFLVLACLPGRLKQKSGLFNLPRSRNWKADSVLFAQLVIVSVLVNLGQSECSKFDLETALYQASLPGLDEEILFRSILLLFLNEAFGTPLKVWGVSIGWGALPIAAFFALAHGFSAGAETQVFVVAIIGHMALSLWWLRERTQSVWLAVAAHNLANVLGLWAAACP